MRDCPSEGNGEGDSDTASTAIEDVDRIWVRVTEDVGAIQGLDGHQYEIGEGDQIALPAGNANALLDKGAVTWACNPPPDAPPEPVVHSDGTVEVVYVHEDDTRIDPGQVGRTVLRSVQPGTWSCERCGTEVTTGVNDGELIEPDECQGCDRQGPFTHVNIEPTVVQAALRADEMWHPPAGVAVNGFDTLWDDVRDYIYDHWDAGVDNDSDAVYAGLTAYALSTWVRENLTFVPHLMTMGRTTGGKTRLLNTLARVSYRAVVAASATPASMFRLIDGYDVTYFISEYHGLRNETRSELDAVIRAGQKRGELVTRAEPTNFGYEPTAFDPFTHVAVATQYDVDDDIKNRCIQTRSSGTQRSMPATLDEERATNIRDRLLGARYRLLYSEEWATAEQDAYAFLSQRGIEGRTREKLLSLLTVAIVWDKVGAFDPFVDLVAEQDRVAVADSEDARFVEVVRDLAFDVVAEMRVITDADPFGAVAIPYDDIAQRYEEMTGEEKTPTWVGHVRKRLGFEKEKKRDGTVISDPDLGPKLRRLCDELRLDWERSETHDPAPELPDEEKGQAAAGCSECGRKRTLTHRNLDTNGRICPDCANDIRAATELESAIDERSEDGEA